VLLELESEHQATLVQYPYYHNTLPPTGYRSGGSHRYFNNLGGHYPQPTPGYGPPTLKEQYDWNRPPDYLFPYPPLPHSYHSPY
jgi:hypothetical protein